MEKGNGTFLNNVADNIQQNTSTSTYHSAFPRSVEIMERHILGVGMWEYFDEVEEDIRVIEKDVMDAVGLNLSSDISKRIDCLIEDVRFKVTSTTMTVEEGAHCVLNVFLILIKKYIFWSYHHNGYNAVRVSTCYKVISDINECKKNISNSIADKTKSKECDSTIQYNNYINKNKLYFDKLQSILRKKMMKLIDHNRSLVYTDKLTAREGIRNIEFYVDFIKSRED